MDLRSPRRVGRALLALACAGALLTAPGLAAADTAAADNPAADTPAADTAAAATGVTDLPDAMPGDRLLVSVRTADGHELHTVAPDGTERTVLTSGEADFAGVWSPDGRHVAFLRIEAPDDALWIVPSDGGPGTRLAAAGRSPSWAPDAARIVYSPSTEAEPRPLRSATLDGTTTPIPGTDGGIEPTWSPDGAQIAYVDPLRDSALVIARVDGADRTVTPGPASGPTWSPVSDRVAYIEGGEVAPRLVLIDSAGSESFLLTDRFARLQQLAYSPTGTHLAFAAAEREGGDLDIWTIRVADGELRRLTDTDDDDFGPTWSASAGTIAFTRRRDIFAADSPSDVFAVPSAGGPARRVTDTGADRAVAFAPGRTIRLAGVDRVATSVALSRTLPSAEAVVIARADAFPDALTGAPLAAALDAPLLLTGRGGLHPSLPAELERLGAETAFLLGGPAALSTQVDDDLRALGIDDVRRVSGTDRFETAVAIAEHLAEHAGPPERLFVVEGLHPDGARGWPDALSASGLAAHTGEPILLVTRDDLPAVTAEALEDHAEARVTIVGGAAAVSREVADEVEARVAGIERVAGADRYATSAAVADLAVAAGADAGHPWLATGRDWPDGLAAASAAAFDGGVLLLVDGRSPNGSPASHDWLVGRTARRGVIVGGTGVVTAPVRAAVEASLSLGGSP